MGLGLVPFCCGAFFLAAVHAAQRERSGKPFCAKKRCSLPVKMKSPTQVLHAWSARHFTVLSSGSGCAWSGFGLGLGLGIGLGVGLG